MAMPAMAARLRIIAIVLTLSQASIIRREVLVPLSTCLLSDRIRDGEHAKVELDAARNRLVVVPVHEANDSMQVDDDDDLEVEELLDEPVD